jgi:type VI protein secretion system component VasF
LRYAKQPFLTFATVAPKALAAQAAMMQAAQRERMQMFVWGAIAGLVGATLLLVAAYLLVQMGTP